MLFAGALISAVAILLGVFTKLPQGGGGLINNLMVVSCFYSTPPLLPTPPPPRAILLDLDASVFDIRQYYIRNLQSTGNITEGPMPSPLAEPLAVPGTETPPAQRSTFSLPDFLSPAFSPPLRFKQLFSTIGATFVRIATAFFALSLPWLAASQLYLLEMTFSARKVASTPLIIATGFEQRFWQIQPHNPLFDDLKIAISERDEALVELKRITKKAKKKGKKALERDHENEESIKGLRKERDNLLAEVAKGETNLQKLRKEKEDEVEVLEKEITKGESNLRKLQKEKEDEAEALEKEITKGQRNLRKLQKEKEDEVEVLKNEITKGEKNLQKLQKEKEDEVGVLKEEITKQARAWEEKEKGWEEKKAGDDKRNQEEKDSLKMGKERESDSWRRQVERLEIEKQGEKEGMGRKLKNISEGMKKERERWAKEREGWKKDKEDEAKERETIETEREAARKALEETRAEEQRRLEEEVQVEAKRAASKLEEEVLIGRKLIEDLQSDKRRDRQLLLELRAQLVRPTHAVPPSHMNPLRFGGSAQAIYGAPIIATSPATPSTNSPASPKGTLPVLPSNPPPSPDAVNQGVDWPPIVRLPPPPTPRRQTIPMSPPPNAPKGPKGWKPGPSGGGA